VGRQILRVTSLHCLDALAIVAAVVLVNQLAPLNDHHRLWPSLVVLVLLGLEANGAYRPGDARRDLRRLFRGVVLAGLVLTVFVVLPPAIAVPLQFLPSFGIAALGVLALARWLADLAVRQARTHGLGLRSAIIVGRQTEVADVWSRIQRDEARDHRILGYVTPASIRDENALGTVDDLDAILERHDPAEVIMAGALNADTVRRVGDACVKHGAAIIAVPSWARSIRGWAEPVKIAGLPGYRVHPARLGMPALLLKRATDLAFTTAGLVVCAPLMGLVAAAIKLDSRGPVFFRQRRVGLGGREFMMWKFRSMSLEAERQQEGIAYLNPYADGRLFKLRDDPRITRVGRLLRRFSLDELPQLFNVLSGDMSLVGPRPPVPSEVGRYEPRHFVRLSVVPGLTGPWQVNGRNLITDFEEVVRLERSYIDEWSLKLDLRIMTKTVGVVLSGKGAY